ncbi:tetratricopeptide repeat protein [Hyphomonas sp. UBA4494]|mgnify:CR=1 FL=1|jgi:TPR repeat protein|uniref:tetratricopeptide repeat protein n=1 Tax=Hyphomonas sp. UBA4494 TaxID=1946631 RepID=UPI0025C6FEC7|nr:tetratricopeptide repeat protein [Hyphomonas sp. UBA4494]
MKISAIRLTGLALLTLLPGAVAHAQTSTNEMACAKGGAEACFYAGADYAQGASGLTRSMPKAAELFMKACTLGIPDGCFYTAGMYRKGADGIAVDPGRGIDLYETACTMGHEEACSATFAILGVADKGEQDIPRLLAAFEKGCANESMKACQWGGEFFYDGRGEEYSDTIDFTRGAPLAYKTCKTTASPADCIMAEVMYAKPDSPAFNAERALELTEINCDANIKESCGNLGRIYATIGDYEMAVGPYEKSCELGHEKICAYAKDLRRYVDEVEAWNAKQAARQAEMATMLNAGDYNGAVGTAVSVYSSTVYAEQAVMAASNAGRMSSVDDYDLKVLEHWFQTGAVGSIVRSEMRRRGLAISGEDNSWARDMQTIKSANARFNAARSTSTYRPIERAPTSVSQGLSSADAAAQTREKYRYAHCTMNNNANRNVCR